MLIKYRDTYKMEPSKSPQLASRTQWTEWASLLALIAVLLNKTCAEVKQRSKGKRGSCWLVWINDRVESEDQHTANRNELGFSEKWDRRRSAGRLPLKAASREPLARVRLVAREQHRCFHERLVEQRLQVQEPVVVCAVNRSAVSGSS